MRVERIGHESDSATFENDQLHRVYRDVPCDELVPKLIVCVERFEEAYQVSQRWQALFNRSHEIPADESADEIEIDRTTSKAWKKRGTVVQPARDDFVAEDRVVEHERSDFRGHSVVFVFEVLRILRERS